MHISVFPLLASHFRTLTYQSGQKARNNISAKSIQTCSRCLVVNARAEDLPGREGDRQPRFLVELLGEVWEGDAGLVGVQDVVVVAAESMPRGCNVISGILVKWIPKNITNSNSVRDFIS